MDRGTKYDNGYSSKKYMSRQEVKNGDYDVITEGDSGSSN